MRCHHWIYQDRGGPLFGKRTELRDGQLVDVPYMIDPGPVDMSDQAIIAEPVFYDNKMCPKCEGVTECPDCGEPLKEEA
jgi:hypothetical protein